MEKPEGLATEILHSLKKDKDDYFKPVEPQRAAVYGLH